MSDKTDPRLDVLRRSITYHLTPDGVAADLDAADREAGVVRVDTNDEALVERLAKVLLDHRSIRDHCMTDGEFIREQDAAARHLVRAALAALRESA